MASPGMAPHSPHRSRSRPRPLSAIAGGLGVFLSLAAVLGPPRAARADDDLLASLYTAGGIELRRDDRLVTLFCALNAVGFDRAEKARTLPFPRLVLHPLRAKMRQQHVALDPKLLGEIEQFLETHPLPVESYVAAALRLGAPPEFTAGPTFPAELAGLDRVLAAFHKGAKLDKAKGLSPDFREELKRLRDKVDEPFTRIRVAYRIPEEDAPALVLLPNPFDASAASLAYRDEEGSHVIVFGLSRPDAPLDLKAALAVYSELLAHEAATAVRPEGLSEVVAALRGQGLLLDSTEQAVVAGSLRRAVEARLWAADAAAAVEAAFREGYVLVREFHRALGEPPEAFPVDKGAFAVQVVQRADVRKAAGELLRPGRR